MAIKLDMGSVKGVQDPGMYTLRLADCRIVEKVDDNGDNADYISARWEVLLPEEWIGSPSVWSNHSLKPQARYFLKNWLEALTQQEWGDDDMELEEDSLVNLTVCASIVHREYNGKVTANVKDWFPDTNN